MHLDEIAYLFGAILFIYGSYLFGQWLRDKWDNRK